MYNYAICLIKSPQYTDKNSKRNILIAMFLPCVLMNHKRQISLLWPGTKLQDHKQETGNDCDIISGLEGLGKQISQTFSYFLINSSLLYHFFGEFISSQSEND